MTRLVKILPIKTLAYYQKHLYDHGTLGALNHQITSQNKQPQPTGFATILYWPPQLQVDVFELV